MDGGRGPLARSAQAHFSQEPPPLSSTLRQWPSALLSYFPTALGTSLKMGSGSGRDLLPCTGQDLEPKSLCKMQVCSESLPLTGRTEVGKPT